LDTDLKRNLFYVKLKKLFDSSQRAEALKQAWTEEHQSTIKEVDRLSRIDQSALAMYVGGQPRAVQQALRSLKLIPEGLTLIEVRREFPEQTKQSEHEQDSARKELIKLRREVRKLQDELNNCQERHDKERRKAQHALETCRERLSQSRKELNLTKKELNDRAELVESLSKQLNDKTAQVTELKDQLAQLNSELQALQAKYLKAQVDSEATKTALQEALERLETLQKEPTISSETLLTLLSTNMTAEEQARLDYSRLKAARRVQRALDSVSNEQPVNLLGVWRLMLQDEEAILSEITNIEQLSSVDQCARCLTLAWDLDEQLHIRVALVQRLRLALSRLLTYYEETRSENVSV